MAYTVRLGLCTSHIFQAESYFSCRHTILGYPKVCRLRVKLLGVVRGGLGVCVPGFLVCGVGGGHWLPSAQKTAVRFFNSGNGLYERLANANIVLMWFVESLAVNHFSTSRLPGATTCQGINHGYECLFICR